MPKISTARHCPRDRRNDWPSASAMPIPSRPDRKNRNESAVSGGAASTMMRADVKAEDQMRAKISPRTIARKSISVLKRERAAPFVRARPFHDWFGTAISR